MNAKTAGSANAGVADEDYLLYLSRRLEDVERQIALLKTDSPGSSELYKYLQFGLNIKRTLEEVRALRQKQEKMIADMLVDIYDGLVRIVKSNSSVENVDRIPRLVTDLFVERTEACKRKEAELRKAVYGVRE
jgi:hypothetical protein